MRSRIVVAGLCLLLTSVAFARQPEPAPPQLPPTTATTSHADDTVAVPEPTELALRYHHTGLILWAFNVIWGLALPAVFLFTGFSARIRTWAQALGKKWFFVVGLYFAIFSVITFVIELPLSYYQGFVRQHAYGLSNQTFAKWLTDSLTGLAVGVVIGALFLWVPYLLLKRSPRRWWLYTGLLMIPFLVLMILVQPVWIDPLFNKFGPMKNKALEANILALAERSGIEGGRVYEVAKSEDTKVLNAYVTGFGNTKRIVLWDTTIAKLDEPELLFVMGHEMGHYVLGHVWKSILFFSAVIMATLFAIHKTAGWLIDRVPGALWVQRAVRRRVAAADSAAVQRVPVHRHTWRAGVHPWPGARVGPLRPGDSPEQPCRGDCVRQAADREPRHPAPALAGQAVAGQPSDAGRAH